MVIVAIEEDRGILPSVISQPLTRSYSTGEKVALFIVRMLTATILCALVLTIVTLIYDRSLYRDDGNALADGMLLLAVSIPFVFADSSFLVYLLPTFWRD